MNTFTKIISVSEIRKNIKDIPKEGGVYKQYVDRQGLEYLDGVYPTTKETASDGTEVYLLYIGLAKDLFDRFKWHLGMTNTSHKSILGGWLSTMRVSYMANHKDILCLSEQDKLNEFMDKHIYIQYLVTKDFRRVEQQLIKENDLPLNIKDNSHTFVQTNKSRRSAIRQKYKKEKSNSIEDGTTFIKTISSKLEQKSVTLKNDDNTLKELARKAEKQGIKNKSQFLRWFRDVEKHSAAQRRLFKAWDERYTDS